MYLCKLYINFFYLIIGHVDHHPGRKNGRRDHRVVAVVHVHEARVLHPDLDDLVPNPSPDRRNPSMPWRKARIKIERGAVRISRTTVREVIAIGRDLKRRAAEARKNPVRRSDPATSQNPNNRTRKVDHQRTTTARRKRLNRKIRRRYTIDTVFQASR